MRRLIRRVHLLPLFLAVVREGGIWQAADKVHLSQSALTRRFQDLESELEVPHFARTARGMTLTQFGQSLTHYAELIALNCRCADDEIEHLRNGTLDSVLSH